MGKVASFAWYRAIGEAMPGRTVFHIHEVNPQSLAITRGLVAADGAEQTIANAAMSRTRVVRNEEAKIKAAWRAGQPIKIVTGIRDPMDRAISIYFFLADFYGHKDRRLSHREQPDLEDLIAYFGSSWQAALAGDPGTGTFDRWLRQELLRYRGWFDSELRDVFGLDVTSVPFDHERHVLRLHTDQIDLIGFRFEDLKAGSGSLAQVLSEASALVGTKITGLPRSNSTEDRRAADLYRAFRARLKLPTDLLDAIYDAPIIRHFYLPAEVDQMKARWAG